MLLKIIAIFLDLVSLYFVGSIVYYEIQFQMKSFSIDAKIKGFKRIRNSKKYLTLVQFRARDGRIVLSDAGPIINEKSRPDIDSTINVLVKKSTKKNHYIARYQDKNVSVIVGNMAIVLFAIVILTYINTIIF